MMLALFKNEWAKFFFTKMNYIMILIIALLGVANVLVPLVIDKDISKEYSPESWQEEVSLEINQLEKENEGEESTTITDELQRLENHLEKDVIPPRKHNLFGVVFELYAIAPLIGIFLIVIASSIVSREFTNKTINYLLMQPVSRSKILLSKLLTILSISLMYLLILFGTSFLIGLLLTDINSSSYFVYANGKENFWLLLVKVMAIMLLEVNILAATAFSFSTIFRNNAVVLGITLILYLVLPDILYLLSSVSEFFIYIWPFHFEMMPYIEATGMPMTGFESNLSLGFSLLMHALHLTPLLTLAFLSFNKRDVLV